MALKAPSFALRIKLMGVFGVVSDGSARVAISPSIDRMGWKMDQFAQAGAIAGHVTSLFPT